MPFPQQTSSDDEKEGDPEHEQAIASNEDADAKPHTVRRKKSSIDLRDMFHNGGPVQSQPPS